MHKPVQFQTSDNTTLHADYHAHANSDKAICFAHGLTVTKEFPSPFHTALPTLHAMGYSTLLFDFRGHGASDGISETDFTVTNAIKDIEAAYDFLQKQGNSEISLCGASFGGAVAALFAGYYPETLEKLILINPALNFPHCFLAPTTEWGKRVFKEYEKDLTERGYIEIGENNFRIGVAFFNNMREYNPEVALMDFKNPLLILQGNDDDKVNASDIEKVFVRLTNVRKRLEILPGGKHGLNTEGILEESAVLIEEFMRETFPEELPEDSFDESLEDFQ